MGPPRALSQALHLVSEPEFARTLRARPFPEDTGELLFILGNNPRVEVADGRFDIAIEDVAFFAAENYVMRVMFAPHATAYRVLGVNPGAPRSQIRRHMALLMLWLHSNCRADATRAQCSAKVLAAWQLLRCERRRLAYDKELVPQAGAARSNYNSAFTKVVDVALPVQLFRPAPSSGVSTKSLLADILTYVAGALTKPIFHPSVGTRHARKHRTPHP